MHYISTTQICTIQYIHYMSSSGSNCALFCAWMYTIHNYVVRHCALCTIWVMYSAVFQGLCAQGNPYLRLSKVQYAWYICEWASEEGHLKTSNNTISRKTTKDKNKTWEDIFLIFLYFSSDCSCDLELGVADASIMCYLPNTTIVVADSSGFHMLVSQGRAGANWTKKLPHCEARGPTHHIEEMQYNIQFSKKCKGTNTPYWRNTIYNTKTIYNSQCWLQCTISCQTHNIQYSLSFHTIHCASTKGETGSEGRPRWENNDDDEPSYLITRMMTAVGCTTISMPLRKRLVIRCASSKLSQTHSLNIKDKEMPAQTHLKKTVMSGIRKVKTW